jgi:DNA ligase-1
MKGNNMKEILNIINQIANTSSRNGKEDILKKNKDNDLFSSILYFVFNPYILTGLSKKKITKKLKLPQTKSTLSIVEVMDYLETHNTGRDEDIILVQNFIKAQPEELQELYTQIVTKDLKIGIEASTINKIYREGFIPEFDVMLAEKYFENENKVKGDFIVTEKLDGNRCVTFNDNLIEMRTRKANYMKDLLILKKRWSYYQKVLFMMVNLSPLIQKD